MREIFEMQNKKHQAQEGVSKNVSILLNQIRVAQTKVHRELHDWKSSMLVIANQMD